MKWERGEQEDGSDSVAVQVRKYITVGCIVRYLVSVAMTTWMQTVHLG